MEINWPAHWHSWMDEMLLPDPMMIYQSTIGNRIVMWWVSLRALRAFDLTLDFWPNRNRTSWRGTHFHRWNDWLEMLAFDFWSGFIRPGAMPISVILTLVFERCTDECTERWYDSLGWLHLPVSPHLGISAEDLVSFSVPPIGHMGRLLEVPTADLMVSPCRQWLVSRAELRFLLVSLGNPMDRPGSGVWLWNEKDKKKS